MPADISERCNTVEECYEFMLAYAAQGLPAEGASASGARIREFLSRAVNAMRRSLPWSTGTPGTRWRPLSWCWPNRL